MPPRPVSQHCVYPCLLPGAGALGPSVGGL